MKPQFATLLLSAWTATNAVAVSIHSNVLPPQHHQRFLQERDQTMQELAQWEASEYGQTAKEFGFHVSRSEEAEALEDDKLARFFATKLAAEEMAKLNPSATFSWKTPFALMTDDEFAAYVGRSYGAEPTGAVVKHEVLPIELAHADAEVADVESDGVDWTTSGCVAPVKNQGHCGNCWTFGGGAGAESFYCLKKNNRQLVTFSEQELTSCDKKDYGCDGGWGEYALQYISKNGICTDIEYPYTSGTTQVSGECLRPTNNCSPVNVGITNYYHIGYDDNALMSWLGVQPVSLNVAAGNPAWRTYTGGVITSCPSRQTDHVVLAVGYTTFNGTDAYRIKNSWGAKWGMDGYLYIARGAPGRGACEIVSAPFIPY